MWLLYMMIFTFINVMFEKNRNKKVTLLLLLLAYCTFGIVSVVYVNIFVEYKNGFASIMFALAVFAAIIFMWISLRPQRVQVNETNNSFVTFPYFSRFNVCVCKSFNKSLYCL